MKPGLVLAGAAAAIAMVAVAAPAIENAVSPAREKPIVAEIPAVGGPGKPVPGATPMAERVATIGVLNKRNGLSRDFRLKPGQGVHVGDLVVKVRACDQTESWEKDQLTGAFVQVIVQGTDEKWRKYFSGWLFKETPSLNVVEHPVYDVWVKACAMRHPDIGPNTVVLSAGDAGGAPTRSKAEKSAAPDTVSEPSPPPVTESAASSNTM